MKNVFSKTWLYAATIRALKTFAQTVLSLVTVGAALSEVDWIYVLSVGATAAILSYLTSIAGLPEVSENEGAE